mmetsp:Transcript_1521/g.3276  ORF Transcript_1521/g.3276 Transcript_1521/m.3276 type:complete len:96 (+) Transcript_1521:200-487(+)
MEALTAPDAAASASPPSTPPRIPLFPLQMSAADVDTHFRWHLGPPETAFDAMGDMGVEALEELQGLADDVSKGGVDEGAQGAALRWSVLIGSFIA